MDFVKYDTIIKEAKDMGILDAENTLIYLIQQLPMDEGLTIEDHWEEYLEYVKTVI